MVVGIVPHRMAAAATMVGAGVAAEAAAAEAVAVVPEPEATATVMAAGLTTATVVAGQEAKGRGPGRVLSSWPRSPVPRPVESRRLAGRAKGWG